MDAFVRGLSKKSLSDFVQREFVQEYQNKHADRTKAFSAEVGRANRVLAQQAEKDNGTDFPSIKEQWKDQPETWRDVEQKPLSNAASMSDVTVPLDAMLEGVHESYYLRNVWRWFSIIGKDWVEYLQGVQKIHSDQGKIQQMKEYIESLPSRDYFQPYTRD